MAEDDDVREVTIEIWEQVRTCLKLQREYGARHAAAILAISGELGRFKRRIVRADRIDQDLARIADDEIKKAAEGTSR